ncbi:HTH-type transcriptional regulator BetI [Baekduia alba]|uniref:TetR/AcrR family transcriptional regulator n=1 Tax=Baekduia alba TaxID=2997333 RepID=UPI0023412EBD|nr:TetR/AcrR family transcriptional regulator [Baekduia alba]WCB93471.1 HTH-type transcriptional regulator BetI [Baekduia alba]
MPTPATFTATARRTQLIGCTLDAIVELGYQRATVAEVAKRAGVSKGVVTYHFAARDDLIRAVAADVFASIAAAVGTRLAGAAPEAFVETYISAWVDYYRTHRRPMLAIAAIWTGFRDPDGRPYFGVATLAEELAGVEAALARGQAEGRLRAFDPKVVAVSMKGALDGLLGQLAADPDLDLDDYAAELIGLFDRATRADPSSPSPPGA